MATTLLTKQAYEKAHVIGTHELAPRVGHYVFKRNKMKLTSKGQEVAIMESLWKPLADASFIETLTFEVAVRTFYSINAVGPKHIDINDLVNKMVIVKEVKISNNVVSIVWDVINQNPVITKPKSLFAMVPMTYNDISRMNNKLGINDNPDMMQAYDSPDDL